MTPKNAASHLGLSRLLAGLSSKNGINIQMNNKDKTSPINRLSCYFGFVCRNKLILAIAKDCGYSKVMLGNCGTQLAVRLLTDMAIGRGSHAAMETVS